MDPRLSWEAVRAKVAERRRRADNVRSSAAAGRPDARDAPRSAAVTIRFATLADVQALQRLAQLDSAAPPTGRTLVAEEHGQLVSAFPLDGGRPIADPFRPTAELVRLLELRAAQLRDHGRPSRRRFFRARPRPRAAER
jgi:hypothetical protein